MRYLISHYQIPGLWRGMLLCTLFVATSYAQGEDPPFPLFTPPTSISPTLQTLGSETEEFSVRRLPDATMPEEWELLTQEESEQQELDLRNELSPASEKNDKRPFNGEKSPLRTQAWWIPTASLNGQSGELSMNGAELDLAFPISISESGLWLANGGIERLEIQFSSLLPTSGLPVPEEFWNIQFGVMHFKELEDEWRTGGMLTFGSASDKPFDAARDLTMTMLAFLSIPARELDTWNLSLFYSPTGQLPFPIPGISYGWNPTETLRVNLGVPFSLHYEPSPLWSIDSSYTPLVNGHALASRKLGKQWTLYGGYRTTCEAFFLAERAQDNERFYLFDQRVMLGVKRSLLQHLEVDFSVAYVFDRKIFQAEQFTSERTDLLNINSSVAGMLQLGWKR